MMKNTMSQDLNNCMNVLEDYIIKSENELIDTNAGDKEWTDLEKYKDTLRNLEYLFSIYGI